MKILRTCACICVSAFFAYLVLLLVWRHAPPNLSNELKVSKIFHLKEIPTSLFYDEFEYGVCVKEGYKGRGSKHGCICKSGWSGKRCALPDVVRKFPWMNNRNRFKNLIMRKVPRKIILVTLYLNMESILKTNLDQVYDLVDAIIIGCPPFVDWKKETFYDKLTHGSLRGFKEKIIPVNITLADKSTSILLDEVGFWGIRLLTNIHLDDLILFSSGEDIFRRENLIFMKLFKNVPTPIKCQMDHRYYNAAWKPDNQTVSDYYCIITVHSFIYIYKSKYENLVLKKYDDAYNYIKKINPSIENDWVMPDSGWRCHYCQCDGNMLIRLLSSNDPHKWLTNGTQDLPSFINKLIVTGYDLNLNELRNVSIKNDELAQKMHSFGDYIHDHFTLVPLPSI